MEMDYAQFDATLQSLTQQIDELTSENTKLHEYIVESPPQPVDEQIYYLKHEKESLLEMLMQYRQQPCISADAVAGLNSYLEKLQIDLESANAQIESLTEENNALLQKCYNLEYAVSTPQEAIDFQRYEETQAQFEAIIAEKDVALEESYENAAKLKDSVAKLEQALAAANAQIAEFKGLKEALAAKEQANYRMQAYISKLVTIANKYGEIQNQLKIAKDKHYKEIEQLTLECNKLAAHEKLYSKMLSDSYQNSTRKDYRIRELEEDMKQQKTSHSIALTQKEEELNDVKTRFEQASAELRALRAERYAQATGASKFSASYLFQEAPLDVNKPDSTTSRAASQLRASSRCIRRMFE